jgi:hypothetical protein
MNINRFSLYKGGKVGTYKIVIKKEGVGYS